MEQQYIEGFTVSSVTKTDLENQLFIDQDENTNVVNLTREGIFIKSVNLKHKAELRVFVVEAIELGANQTYLANALNLSRQTLHNWMECKKYFGIEGLIHNYGSRKKSKSVARAANVDKLKTGNTAEDLRRIRQQEKEKTLENQDQLNFSFEDESTAIDPEEELFEEEHDWKATRYAGNSIYQPVLFQKWSWLEMIRVIFGIDFRIFVVFLSMAIRNIRSIEQLKNTIKSDAKTVSGLKQFPHEKRAREWFYQAAIRKKATVLLNAFTRLQVTRSLINTWIIFTDGHLLPYTGKDKVHYAYNTQRRQVVPGRTNMVSHDVDGMIFDFDIQEGKSDLRGRVFELAEKWKGLLPEGAVHVFDREGTGNEFFAKLVKNKIEFVTWEKNLNKKRLEKLDESDFKWSFTKNGKSYRVFEEIKTINVATEDSTEASNNEPLQIDLRRFCLWNVSSSRKTCGLAWVSKDKMDTVDCAKAILSRWGASENTFKHMNDRHPMHYHPGFETVDSEKQDIVNPVKKVKEKEVSKTKTILDKLKIAFSGLNKVFNHDGSERRNSKYQKTAQKIVGKEWELRKLQEEKKELPDRVNVTDLEDYRSFKKIDNEGKYLFDFVTSSVWNARKWMVQELSAFYGNDDEVVDLFYAISECHGWTRVTDKLVIFRLEPLQTKKRRLAQEYLCKKLTSLGYFLPNGKRMMIEVGNSPVFS